MPRVMRGAPTIGHDMVTRLHAAAVKPTTEQFQKEKNSVMETTELRNLLFFHHP